MFLKSIALGYYLLSDYKIWIAAVLFGICFNLNILFVSKLFPDKNTWLSEIKNRLVNDIFNSFLITLTIYFLIIIILGGEVIMPLVSPSAIISILIKSLLFSTLIFFLIGFIPILGGYIKSTSAAQLFLFALISLIIILQNKEVIKILISNSTLENLRLISKKEFIEIIPGFWTIIGFMAMVFINIIILIIPFSILEDKFDLDSIIILIMPSLNFIAALVSIGMIISYFKLGLLNL